MNNQKDIDIYRTLSSSQSQVKSNTTDIYKKVLPTSLVFPPCFLVMWRFRLEAKSYPSLQLSTGQENRRLDAEPDVELLWLLLGESAGADTDSALGAKRDLEAVGGKEVEFSLPHLWLPNLHEKC